MADLFTHQGEQAQRNQAPLADRMRPVSLTEFVGQEKAIGPGTMLRQALEADQVPSMILWGPPGTGKTTLGRVIASLTVSTFVLIRAVTSGVAELRKVIAEAEERRNLYKRRTILFVDEIHRWSKSQQDALLPYVEDGTVTLIGATTENPSFEVVSALLSRCRVMVLQKLTPEHLAQIVKRALKDGEKGLGNLNLMLDKKAETLLAHQADGDARAALNALELAAKSVSKMGDSKGEKVITVKDMAEALQASYLRYDKTGEEHYNVISALHKSLRGSDVDGALYWLGRMLEAGEDPLYVARRMVRFASEDIGLADSQALTVAVAGYQATHFIGMPECNVVLAQVAAYLAKAPKSNALYEAYGKVQRDLKEFGTLPVPLHIRNAPTKLMKELDYGKGYQYNPKLKKQGKEVTQKYLPDELANRRYLED